MSRGNDHPTPTQFLLSINPLNFVNLAESPEFSNVSPGLLSRLLRIDDSCVRCASAAVRFWWRFPAGPRCVYDAAPRGISGETASTQVLRVPSIRTCAGRLHTFVRAGAVGLDADGDHSELVMDEDEAEGAAAPAESQPKSGEAKEGSDTAAAETGGADLQPVAVALGPQAQQSAPPESVIKEVNASGVNVLACDEVSSNSEMQVEVAASKLRCGDLLAASQERRLSELKKVWKVVGGRGKACASASHVRSASLPRGGKTAP
ncbi:hypothetical protein HPB47_012046 [Ixodes persulcatus]|uniref:Uncharacterized protein n=1 Tax=Ixodes persulcatus TaxID=34615 RepID=A0AC60NUN8_IXOPE|nr:hypothetical protein HPB47_012046 [Ixodes persulcatus]